MPESITIEYLHLVEMFITLSLGMLALGTYLSKRWDSWHKRHFQEISLSLTTVIDGVMRNRALGDPTLYDAAGRDEKLVAKVLKSAIKLPDDEVILRMGTRELAMKLFRELRGEVSAKGAAFFIEQGVTGKVNEAKFVAGFTCEWGLRATQNWWGKRMLDSIVSLFNQRNMEEHRLRFVVIREDQLLKFLDESFVVQYDLEDSEDPEDSDKTYYDNRVFALRKMAKSWSARKMKYGPAFKEVVGTLKLDARIAA